MMKDSVILLEQLRTIDKKRLRDRVCHLEYEMMQSVDGSPAGQSGSAYIAGKLDETAAGWYIFNNEPAAVFFESAG